MITFYHLLLLQIYRFQVNVLNGKEYTFFICYMSDIDIHDYLKFYDGGIQKNITFIQ